MSNNASDQENQPSQNTPLLSKKDLTSSSTSPGGAEFRNAISSSSSNPVSISTIIFPPISTDQQHQRIRSTSNPLTSPVPSSSSSSSASNNTSNINDLRRKIFGTNKQQTPPSSSSVAASSAFPFPDYGSTTTTNPLTQENLETLEERFQQRQPNKRPFIGSELGRLLDVKGPTVPSIDDFGETNSIADFKMTPFQQHKAIRSGRQRKKTAARSKGGEFQARRKKRRIYFCCIGSEIDVEGLADKFLSSSYLGLRGKMYSELLHLYTENIPVVLNNRRESGGGEGGSGGGAGGGRRGEDGNKELRGESSHLGDGGSGIADDGENEIRIAIPPTIIEESDEEATPRNYNQRNNKKNNNNNNLLYTINESHQHHEHHTDDEEDGGRITDQESTPPPKHQHHQQVYNKDRRSASFPDDEEMYLEKSLLPYDNITDNDETPRNSLIIRDRLEGDDGKHPLDGGGGKGSSMDEIPNNSVTIPHELLEEEIIANSSYWSNGGREVFVYDFGALVFWGYHRDEVKELLEFFKEYVSKGKLSEDEFKAGEDDMAFVLSQETDKITIANDVITLPEYTSVKQRLAVSFAIAQSTILSIFEARIEEKIDLYKYIPEALAKSGKINLSAKELGNMIGEVFVIRHDVNLHNEILSIPDYFWKENSVEPLYRMTSLYLEMEDRTEVLNKRLDLLRELLNVLQHQHENVHYIKLEWIIIWLIVVSVVLEGFVMAGKLLKLWD